MFCGVLCSLQNLRFHGVWGDWQGSSYCGERLDGYWYEVTRSDWYICMLCAIADAKQHRTLVNENTPFPLLIWMTQVVDECVCSAGKHLGSIHVYGVGDRPTCL